MHFTPENIVEILKALTLLVAAISGCIAARQSTRAKVHAVEAADAAKEAVTTGHVNAAKIDDVHACLSNAREEIASVAQDTKKQSENGSKEQNGEGAK